jgi:hypothetical protein
VSDERDKGEGVKILNFFTFQKKYSLGPVGILSSFQKVIALDFP